MHTPITQSPIWQTLKMHQQDIAHLHLRDVFAEDSHRFAKFSLEANGLLLDYSKNRLTEKTRQLLIEFAEAQHLSEWIAKLFSGEALNNTEGRAALHTALRNRSNRPVYVAGEDVMPAVNQVLAQMRSFTEQVRNGDWLGYTGKPIDTIVNIGIGGSDLGPTMVTRALRAWHHPRLSCHFVSNVDATHLAEILPKLNPETTLFIIASKSFSTQETLLNARSARHWLLSTFHDEQAVARHFIAISTATEKVTAFGIDPANMFVFWDWVGGRFSLWSAIGMSIVLMVGMDNFEQLLAGAHAMDNHFQTAPFAENLPVLLGLIGMWYVNFWGAPTQALLPYDFALELFPAHMQQLIMESLGKRITRYGTTASCPTCPVIWGAAGNNGQHAFYQLLHQGTHIVPTDFLIAIESQHNLPDHQVATLSNALAQTHALMAGRSMKDTGEALAGSGVHGETLQVQLPHRTFLGNQPSNTLVYQKLSPEVLGGLIALYEHKVFVQAVCWELNPFDQWGVELGKQVANSLLPEFNSEQPSYGHDASTDGLLAYIRQRMPKQ